MPSFEIQLDVFKRGRAFSGKEFRKSIIISLTPNHNKFTKEDFRAVTKKIKDMMIKYNNGYRGGKMVFKNIHTGEYDNKE